jgi:hypothetical protein
MERLLRSLLPSRDRETVAGDLYEEFRERKAAQPGSPRATFWYLRQVVSFAPRRMRSLFVQEPALRFLCALTALCSCWLGTMELWLRHPGFAGRVAIAGVIVCQALLTLGALRFRQLSPLRSASMLGCVALSWLAGKALVREIRGTDFEGYVLLISLALILQVLLTVPTLREMHKRSGHSV